MRIDGQLRYCVEDHDCTSFLIAERRIGIGEPIFIIAEVGINHEGNVDLCAQMIQAAARAGADAIKLQLIDPKESYVEGTESYKMFQNKALDDDALEAMVKLSKQLGVILFATPGDFISLERMHRFNMPAVKISSGLMTNKPLIVAAAKKGFPLIISTGLAYEYEISTAIETACYYKAPGVAILKCTALYPAPDETLNLASISTMRQKFNIPVGYSDHTLNDLACIAAVTLGATIIEKHFTLDKQRQGVDHHISMEPKEFAIMINQIRRVEVMQGCSLIKPNLTEAQERMNRHRCLIARHDIAVGEKLSENNIALKRPFPGLSGLPPVYYEEVLGKLVNKSILRDQPICIEDVVGLI